MEAAYFDFYELLIRTSRWHAMARAAALVLGDHWYERCKLDQDSDEGLRDKLRWLEDERLKQLDAPVRKRPVGPL